jgi:hypothetical protein
MVTPFYLIWQRDDLLLRGRTNQTWVDGQATFPISFPGRKTEALPLTLRSSARDSHTFETLKSVQFYLTGTDVPIVQEEWPTLGDAFTPVRPELSGGFEVSFDRGRSWTRFSSTVGHASDPATWVSLPALAVGLNGVTGQLGPFDQAHLLVRYVIPPQAADFKIFDIQLAVDFDIV